MSGNHGNGRCEFETELAEMPPSWKTEYDLWHPNRQSMSDRNGAGETATGVQFNRHFCRPRTCPESPESCLELTDMSKLGIP